MKVLIFTIVLGSIFGASYFIFDESVLDVVSDLSSILFFAFATLFMLGISGVIAMDIAKLLNYKTLNREYEALKKDLHAHITRNIYTIEVTKEAKLKHQEYEKLNKEIHQLKGEDYEV